MKQPNTRNGTIGPLADAEAASEPAQSHDGKQSQEEDLDTQCNTVL
jgi:hypothetical protein